MPKTPNTEQFIKTIPLPETIFETALLVKPEISAAKLRIEGAERNISVAKSYLLPRLDLNGGIGSNYYKTSGELAESFSSQMKNKFNQEISLTLSIPIFNRMQTRNSIRTAKIEHQNRMLDLDEKKKTLFKEIQLVYYNTLAAESKYQSAVASLASSQDAFTLMREKYENGKANNTEFNESKTNLMKAESELMKAKYEYMYQTSLVDFYSGNPLKL